VKGPDPKFMAKPWALHPYQYVEQNPIVYWDPDGRQPAGQITPTTSTLPAAPSPSALQETGGLYSLVVNMGQQYKLNAQALAILGPYFMKEFNFDVRKVRFEFGGTISYTNIFGPDAFTIGNDVLLNSDKWDRMSERKRFLLLAHEITHCVQFEREGNTWPFATAGLAKFGYRYVPEYRNRDDNYDTSTLQNVHIDKSNVTSGRWTYDQIAERVSEEVGKLIAP
jgi:Domain of unknown function (DUF4157)